MNYQLAPSFLSADFNRAGEQIAEIERAGCTWLHLDVMDGAFVPSISFGMPVISSIRKESDLYFDVHMMVEDPGRYISDMKNAGAQLISVHAEACTHLDRVLAQIHDAGLEAGIALNPATPIDVCRYVLDKTDLILLMSVNPGFGGQKYLPAITEKIRELRNELDFRGYSDIMIEVDGGVTKENLPMILDAGANIIVAGTTVFKGDITQNIVDMQAIMKEYEAKAIL